MRVLRVVAAACCAGSADALLIGPATAPRPVAMRACPLPTLAPARFAPARMQQPSIDESSSGFYDEYVETDPVTGESKALSLDEKEKLYLECLDAYYNENGRQLLSDEDYEQLKLDMDFEGSKIAVFSKDEIRFVLANKRYKMGKPVMDDAEYDKLRIVLRDAGSPVVLHDGTSCSVETGLCKSDLRVDSAKMRLLYFPGTAGGLILTCEALYWTLGLDPILSIILGAAPAYFFGVWFTENIFAQKPLVVAGNCPECQSLETIYFGDLFNVQKDGIVKPSIPEPLDEIDVKCSSCKAQLTANRQKMLFSTVTPKN